MEWCARGDSRGGGSKGSENADIRWKKKEQVIHSVPHNILTDCHLEGSLVKGKNRETTFRPAAARKGSPERKRMAFCSRIGG